jgi:hypothetical protein
MGEAVRSPPAQGRASQEEGMSEQATFEKPECTYCGGFHDYSRVECQLFWHWWIPLSVNLDVPYEAKTEIADGIEAHVKDAYNRGVNAGSSRPAEAERLLRDIVNSCGKDDEFLALPPTLSNVHAAAVFLAGREKP